MSPSPITFCDRRDLEPVQVVQLYEANGWAAARKPRQLCQGLMNSHSLISAWCHTRLVGLGNAISDGHLVVYYPHLLVHPQFQGQGIGRQIMARMQQRYGHLHMQMLVADGDATEFYRKCGFVRAGTTESMWVYGGGDHE